MSSEILIDALPYIDSGYDEPGVKQTALSLIEEECKRFKSSKNYLEIFGPVNLHMFEVLTYLTWNYITRLIYLIFKDWINEKWVWKNGKSTADGNA